uniref:Uncharacterized protein n=1 Tax=Magallana gigas TaxID=29159 RepID=A0A8W8MKD7_MAGGI
MKITGDNVDVYVRTSSLNRERRNKDLHLFASNIIFSRIATIDMPNTPPVRLQEAKNIRSLAVTPERRYDDLHPIVCEIVAFKARFLEKCYKKFFGEKHSSSQGTLAHFKTILHRTDVNGKVKGRFKPHFELLMLVVGECMVQEQFLNFSTWSLLIANQHIP